MIRVLIADDHQLMRAGLKALLAEAKDIQIVGEAEDGLEAVDMALRTNPDVVLMDASMPSVGGFQATEQIRALEKDIKVLFVSGFSNEPVLRKALQSGALGYVVKSANPRELPLAIRAVSRGEYYFSPEVFSYLSQELLNNQVH